MIKPTLLGEKIGEQWGSAHMLSALHTFHALKYPEPHFAAYLVDKQAAPTDDILYYYPQLEMFKQDMSPQYKSTNLQRYVGETVIMLQSRSDAVLRGESFRPRLVSYGELIADAKFDRPLWVDRQNKPVSINQILPDAELLHHAYDTYDRSVPCRALTSFIIESLAALEGRYPSLPELG